MLKVKDSCKALEAWKQLYKKNKKKKKKTLKAKKKN